MGEGAQRCTHTRDKKTQAGKTPYHKRVILRLQSSEVRNSNVFSHLSRIIHSTPHHNTTSRARYHINLFSCSSSLFHFIIIIIVYLEIVKYHLRMELNSSFLWWFQKCSNCAFLCFTFSSAVALAAACADLKLRCGRSRFQWTRLTHQNIFIPESQTMTSTKIHGIHLLKLVNSFCCLWLFSSNCATATQPGPHCAAATNLNSTSEQCENKKARVGWMNEILNGEKNVYKDEQKRCHCSTELLRGFGSRAAVTGCCCLNCW